MKYFRCLRRINFSFKHSRISPAEEAVVNINYRPFSTLKRLDSSTVRGIPSVGTQTSLHSTFRNQAAAAAAAAVFGGHRCYCQNRINDDEDWSNVSIDDELNDDDAVYRECISEQYILPEEGQRVLIIQPDIKWGPKRPKITSAALQVEEGCALIRTLPKWNITETKTISLKHVHPRTIFGKGNYADLTRLIRSRANGMTAVFINVEMLNSIQLATMQSDWNIPIYDRYTIVLQIFKVHARTNEAKLQVALAELPYFRSRLRGAHDGNLSRQRGMLSELGGDSDVFIDTRRKHLQDRESKINKILTKLKNQRQIIRQSRKKRQIPIVAVVGYTNSGKTSLIKALTGEENMTPKDQLFATLDITAHAGKLSNGLTVIYLDTVGFIRDIPTGLIDAFSATLEDVLNADVLLHVRDVSHPDSEAQKLHVKETLQMMDLPQNLLDDTIEVCNKCDKLDEIPSPTEDSFLTSAVSGLGLGELGSKVEKLVLESKGILTKKLKVPANGTHLSWLYKEATVQRVTTDESGYNLLVHCLMSPAAYGKFKSQFGKKKS
ncbi:putative GTP-binding protein 6 [Tubulanus polymorphus]|uniref:putative GTP-binding protein 6 n=1 Tax=Tubulanus polymorphus TaxID=672921 RepID=UPI003DA5AF17